MEYLTQIINCKTNVETKQFHLSSTFSSLYLDSDDLTPSSFNTTLIINNHSNMFIKNVNLSTINQDQKNINIINTNQSKLYGVNVNLPTSNLSTFNLSSFGTLIVNTKNSQSTISSNQLNDIYLINSRNEDSNFYNFPSPFQYPNSYIIPTMISNGERTKWSWNYGYIKDGVSLQHFILDKQYNLNGQSFTFTINQANKHLLEDQGIKNFHNGNLTFTNNVEGGMTLSAVNIQNCASKITLQNFKFEDTLNIINCRVVYLKNCNWARKKEILPEVADMEYSLYQWKQGKTDWVNNICLNVDIGSKVYIENTTDLRFSNFFIGVKANNNSQIYFQKPNNSNKIVITENLSNYSMVGNRPVFLLACNGSRIYCIYDTVQMNITYPQGGGYYYKPEEQTASFNLSQKQFFISDLKNYKRMKSCLVALQQTSNNSQIYTSFFLTEETYLQEPEEVSIPLFGLFQIAKPGNGDGGWYSVNTVHILSGSAENHIVVNNNGEYRLNLRDSENNIKICTSEAFMHYNFPYSTVAINVPYAGTQPHLAHYYKHTKINKPTGEEYQYMTNEQCPPQDIVNSIGQRVQMACLNSVSGTTDRYNRAKNIIRTQMYVNTYTMKDI